MKQSLVVLFHHALKVSLVFLFLDCLALVVKLLASAKPQLDFYESVLEVDFERNERIAFLLDFSAEFVYLGFVEQKFACAARVNVVVTAHFVGRNMCAEHKNFAVFDYDKTVSEVDRSEANGFDLTPHKHYACLVGVLNKIIVIGFFVGCNLFYHSSIIQYLYIIFKGEE